MKARIAFWLRKLADFFDPKVKPSDENRLTIYVNADTSQFEQSIEAVRKAIRSVDPEMDRLIKASAELSAEFTEDHR